MTISDSPGSLPNNETEEAINANAEFCCVVKTRLAGLLYRVGVDALRKEAKGPWETVDSPDEVPTLKSFVLLRDTKDVASDKKAYLFQM